MTSSSSPFRLLPSRRASSRREVILPCQAVRLEDFRLIADRMIDLSTDGMFLPLRRQVATGESLIVSFSLPGMWIDLEATVARVVLGRRPGDDGLAAGVLFDHVPAATRAVLAGFLHGRRAPLPRRGPLARLRRGHDAPQLADAALMAGELDFSELLADPCDVFDVLDDDDIIHEEPIGETSVDGLGVLRAVVGAWQSLTDLRAT
jgi:hypothetical protein